MKGQAKAECDEFALYTGRWVALVHGRVTGVGWTSDEARMAAKHSRPKEEPAVYFVPEGGEFGGARLPEWPWQIVRRLARGRGQRIWLVGGAVRDMLLGRPWHDWDFAVDRGALALARAVADALCGAYYPMDAERDTGRVIVATADGARLVLDFATLRGGSLERDLSLRDFTVNAMAWSEGGLLVDPTGGLADLEARLIRAASEHAFRDDALRLLRAVRVGAELQFEIEPQTLAQIRRDAALLSTSSAERVRDELVRLLVIPGAAGHLQRLDELGLLFSVVPELERTKGVAQSLPHVSDVWHHTLAVVDALEGVIAAAVGGRCDAPALVEAPAAAWGQLARALGRFAGKLSAHLAVTVTGGHERALLLKLGALLHDVGKPETRAEGEDGRVHFYGHEAIGARLAAERLHKLRFSRNEVRRVEVMIGGHMRPPQLARAGKVTPRAVHRYFRDLGDVGVEVVLLSLADHLATWGARLQEQRWARRLEVAATLLTHYFERYEETIAPPPLITGHDLMTELGLSTGPEIGRLLALLREAQAAGEVRTREEALALARRTLGRPRGSGESADRERGARGSP